MLGVSPNNRRRVTRAVSVDRLGTALILLRGLPRDDIADDVSGLSPSD